MQYLKQSTDVDVLIGPFLDITDARTAETGESPSVKLSKNGQALAAKNDVTTPVHDADGFYNCELDATDTNTLGTLVLSVAASANALPVRHEFMVVDADFYNALDGTAALATGSDLATVDSNVDAVLVDTGTTLPATLSAIEGKVDTVDTVVDGIQTDLSNATDGLGAIKAAIDAVKTDLDNGTDGLGALKTLIDTIDTVVDGIQTDLNNGTDGLGALKTAIDAVPTAAENADELLNTDMSAATDTNARTPLNALRFLRNKWSVSGSTLTVTKEDDTTTAWTASLTSDAAADPVTGSDPA